MMKLKALKNHSKLYTNIRIPGLQMFKKTQKKKIFETNLSVIGVRENAKYGQKLKKGPIFNIFQKFQKHVNSYPILYQNAKFGGPRVKNVGFRAKKMIF